MNYKIKNLKISNNALTRISPRAFITNVNLQHLDLSNNNIFFNESTQLTWTSLTELQSINLAHNDISLTEIPYSWRHNWLNLKTLNVSHNRIGSELDVLHLKFEQNEITVDLSHNLIRKVKFGTATIWSNNLYQSTFLSENRVINITNNPIICDCDSLHLAEILRGNMKSSVQHWFKFSGDKIICSAPENLKNQDITQVPFQDFVCSEEKCPKECKCNNIPYISEIYLGCDGNGLEKIPTLTSLSTKFLNLTLNLANNNLKRVDIALSERMIYNTLTSLILSNNNITTLTKEDLPMNINNILYIDGNHFKHINTSVLDTMKTLRSLKLGNNNFECDCESYELYRFVMQNKRIIEDLENITFACNNTRPLRAVNINDQNEINNKNIFCTNYQNFISTVILPIALVLLVVFVVAFIIIFNKELILIKLYGNPITRRCFASEKEYDALPYDVFVSYAHQDEQYVEEVLVPGLEETKNIKYKCLVHVRDFIPGRSISEQIVEAVENSKRTIICLSKHFIASDWAQHEFEIAHRRKRVVIVLVGELPTKDEMSSDFWQYVSSNTYLSCKDKWFWEKLQFALPHGNNSSSDGKHFGLTTVSKRLKLSDPQNSNLQSNGRNGIHLFSDESVTADEQPTTTRNSNESNVENGTANILALPRSSSPAPSTSTMTTSITPSPSPKPKREANINAIS